MYRDEWQKHAGKYNFLVLCPELSKSDFPFWEYQYGNIYDKENKKFNPKDVWTFNLIEELFDFVREERKMRVGSYCIFGHSAGAQFVQRMVLFMPESRFSLAIANGAGWYTLPNFKYSFYRDLSGLKGSPVTGEGLKKAFEKKLIILMGDKDFVTKTSPASYAATKHKWDRVWRAKFFYKEAHARSEQMGAEFNWIYKTVPDADHNNPKHALWASRYASKSSKNISRQLHGAKQKSKE